jgi:FKBP-type peptidyl-prolyl cis-trans isomerase
MRIFPAALFLLTFAAAASAQDAPRQAPADVAKPSQDSQRTKSGLEFKVVKPGTGTAHPAKDDLVTVNYTAWTSDGKTFDSSPAGRTVTFGLDRVMPGLQEGIQLMVAGETRRLWIPDSLAKGQNHDKGRLVFDVELVSFTPSPAKAPDDVRAVPGDATKTASGLAYKILTPGTGTRHPTSTATVVVNYSGWTAEGKLFDSSLLNGQTATLQLNGVIPGWTEGLQLMVEGEKARFWVPDDLGYKGRGPVNGLLVFDIELVRIQ